jgi:hypothetical protein
VAGSLYLLSPPALREAGCRLTGCDGRPAVPLINGSHEDVFLAELVRGTGTELVDTRDGCGAERFNPFHPEGMLAAAGWGGWYGEYTYNHALGYGCCSSEPICYHSFKSPSELRDFHALVGRLVRPGE